MPLVGCNWGGGTSISNLGRNLKEEVVVHVALLSHCAGAMKLAGDKGIVGRETLSRERRGARRCTVSVELGLSPEPLTRGSYQSRSHDGGMCKRDRQVAQLLPGRGRGATECLIKSQKTLRRGGRSRTCGARACGAFLLEAGRLWRTLRARANHANPATTTSLVRYRPPQLSN
jgi:hypothetical protein